MALNFSAFQGVATKPKTTLNLSAFGVKNTKKEENKIITKTLPSFLGGGAYNQIAGQPSKLATSTRSYAGVPTTEDKERHHIIPVEFGGSSETDQNILTLPLDSHKRITNLETKISADYKAGKIALGSARLQMMTALQKELDAQKGIKQGVLNNLWGGVKQLGSDIKGLLIPSQEELKTAYDKSQPNKLETDKHGVRVTNYGLVTKIGNNYTATDVSGAVGSMKNVAKEGLDNIGKQLLKNIKKTTIGGEVMQVGKNIASNISKVERPVLNTSALEPLIKLKQDPLIQEARKEIDVFRGGGFDKKRITELGVSVSRDKRIANTFDPVRGNLGTGVSEDLVISSTAKIAKETDIPKELVARLNEKGTAGEQAVVNWGKRNGYDAIDFGEITGVDEIRVINPDVLKIKSQSLQEVNPLIQEARKYKSASEFIKAQGTPVYHGTNAKFDKFDVKKIGSQTDEGMFGKGFYFTPNKKMAEIAPFGEKAKFVKEVNLDIKKPLEINNFKTVKELAEHLDMVDSAFIKDSNGIIRPVNSQIGQFTSHVKDIGYDSVYVRRGGVGDEIVVFDPSKIKTKSQLTDIWNKANKADIANQMGFAKLPKTMVNAAESINPIIHQDAEVQSIFKTWTRKLLQSEEVANKQLPKIGKVADKGETILKYEKGTPTKYTETIKKEFDALFTKAKNLGVDVGYKENYLPQVYNNTTEEIKTAVSKYMKDQGVNADDLAKYLDGIKELPDVISKRLKLNPFFTKERALPSYEVAKKYGLTPKYTEPSQLLAHYEAELGKTVANKEFINELLKRGKIATVDRAGTDWEALSLPFSPKGYYAPPELAKMLNGMFRNEEMLGAIDTGLKWIAQTSKWMQEITLSAGIPKTSVNFFAIGQLVKNLTAGEFKSAVAFIRSNFNGASIKFLQNNAEYLEKMSNQGIDILKRVDSYGNIYKKISDVKGISAKIGMAWDKAFGEKTFKSFMPQMQVQTFKDVYTNALKKMSPEQAEKLAGDTVKAFYGLLENVGRGKGTEDVLSATFFAPKFREGIIKTLFNTGKSITTEIFNPAFRKNRQLLAGMILTYAGYNALNYKLSGHYMWENPDGKEFDLMIPTKMGNTKDDVVYLGFMPSFLAFARNMASGGIALVKGDTSTAKQKIGSLFSMPIKLASEIWANKDYFGRDIYKNTDDKKTKLTKIAEYAFLQYNHPYVDELYKQITTDKPLYQSVSEALELPFKFSSYTKIEKEEFYNAIRKQDAQEAKVKEKFKPKYQEIKNLLEAGKIDEATTITEKLSDDEYKIYNSLKRADKSRDNINEEIKIFDEYKQIQELMANGKVDEATAITSEMTDEEYKAYNRLKAKLNF